jgi:3-oxoacyl-[acyl-carrier protein] reductase
MTEEAFDAVGSANPKDVVNCTQVVDPYMIHPESGDIVGSSSLVGADGNLGQTNYVATKAGVIGKTKVWARELGHFNFLNNAIAPGMVLTERLLSMPKDVFETFSQRPPLKQLGTLEEVACLYLFLTTDESSHISAEAILIDCGMVIGT